MREIKFRAWDKKRKAMLPVTMISEIWVSVSPPDNDDEGNKDYDLGYRLYKDGSGAEEAAVMQYTGLKDKNGVEIYEGDILSDKWKAQAYFKNGSYWVKSHVWQNNDTYLHAFIKSREQAKIPVEVIGNIYENPELLE